jgi:hypothetical protein
MCAKGFLEGKDGLVAIFTGDAPLVKEETVLRLVEHYENGGYSAAILTSIVDNPAGYGRIIRGEQGVEKIVEHKDCKADELLVKEINAGMYIFDIKSLVQSLDKLSNNNAQGEYYLTDIIGILKKEDKTVGALAADFEETLGVNSKIELAAAERTPLILVSAGGGGARMHEGIFSLMQMAKTSQALNKMAESRTLYISVLTDPTMGGVFASFASLGDIIIAEPDALIGFAGPRVIQQTIRQTLPEGFQTSQFLLEHGIIDMIVNRKDLKATLVQLIRFHSHGGEAIGQ